MWNDVECASVGSRQKINEVLKRPITKRASPALLPFHALFSRLKGEVRIEMACRRGQSMGRRDDRSCDLRRALRRCAIKKMAYFVRPLRSRLTSWNPISNRTRGVTRSDGRRVRQGRETLVRGSSICFLNPVVPKLLNPIPLDILEVLTPSH